MLLREDFIASCGDNRNFIHDKTCDSVRSFVVGHRGRVLWMTSTEENDRNTTSTHHNMYYVYNLVLLFIYFHFFKKTAQNVLGC